MDLTMTISVSSDELRTTAKNIEGLADDYKTLYSEQLLKQNLGDLENAWYGKDSTSYSEQVRGFQKNFEEMYALMIEYVAHLRKAADEYDRHQDELAAGVKNL